MMEANPRMTYIHNLHTHLAGRTANASAEPLHNCIFDLPDKQLLDSTLSLIPDKVSDPTIP